MRVLVHALGATMGGAMRHLSNFLPELAAHDEKREYTVLVRESFPELPGWRNIRVERVADRNASGWIARLAGDICGIPIKVRSQGYGVLVSLTNFGPVFTPGKHIFFQRNPLYYCNCYLSRVSGRLRAETLLRRRLAVESMKRADVIVTPSAAMGEMIRAVCPEIADRNFRTVYHGFVKSSLADPLDDRLSRLMAFDGVKLLYPTHPAPHKGFDILWPILQRLRRELPAFRMFVTIAREDWPGEVGRYEAEIRRRGLEDIVVFTGRVPQRMMGAVYEACDLMLYPSLCESFGFSMVEAMGHGLPIVAAGTAVNREVCGGAAVHYDPENPDAGIQAVLEALMPERREALRRAGHNRVTGVDWSWRRYAREFAGLVEAIA